MYILHLQFCDKKFPALTLRKEINEAINGFLVLNEEGQAKENQHV